MRERLRPDFESLNIMLVSPYSMEPPGGAQENIKGTSKYFTRHGHRVTIVSPLNHQFPEMDKVSYAANRIFLGEVKPHEHNGTVANVPEKRPVNPVLVHRALSSTKPDIIHGHDSYASAPALQLLLQSKLPLTGIKNPYLFQTFHAFSETEKPMYKIISQLRHIYDPILDGTIVVSPATARFAKKLFPRDHREIHNGIEVSRFSREDGKIGKYLDAKFNILYVGRLEGRKGVKYLLDAYSIVKKHNENIRLIIAGDGPQKNQLMDQVQSCAIRDVEFEGRVTEEDLPKYYKTADACTFFATHAEAQGIVLFEAMAAGKPTIAGNNEGFKTVIKQGKNGLLVNPKKPQEAAATMKTLIENEGLRNRLAENGFKTALEHDWECIGKQQLDFYREKIEEKLT